MKKYLVELTSEERSQLREIIDAERMAAHKRRHARMLLKLDQGPDGPGWSDAQVAAAFDCTARSAERLRRRLVERGLDAALEHGNRGSYRARALDGVAEAHLIALACGDAPEGRNRWTVRLLADQMVSLGLVESCSKSSVHRVLKKTSSSLT
ncbi:MAG: helix-turn-helix domain-containing protein [Candidatus Eisenbacteria sp.]|nr:helix-turn-helix domain-containing protein [Candidatus Eisenbacteria bacterium]